MTTEALPQTSHPSLALRPVKPHQGVAPEGLHLNQFPLTVGAGPTCSIRITTPGTRPLHCLIVETERGVTIRRWADDTQLNGESFSESLLRVGDHITCGEVEFEVVEASDALAEGVERAETPAPPMPVAWPASGVSESFAPEGRLKLSPAEPPSLEQASEVLRLAENCQRLEDELAETRSLLTSLGEELLQARETAVRQATRLTSRIDELEEDLAERDNLLLLLQEALEQRTESLATDLDLEGAVGFETESTAGSLTSQIPAEQESPESEFEGLESSDRGSSHAEPACDDLTGEANSPEEESPDFGPTPEPSAALDWSPLPAEPEADLSDFPLAETSTPSDTLSPAASAASGGDLWDIEKASSDAGEVSPWGEVTASEDSATAFDHKLTSDLSPEPTPCVSPEGFGTSSDEATDEATIEETSKSLPPTVEPTDPWGSGSLWPSSETSDEPPSADESMEESALLWGQSLLNESKAQPEATSLFSGATDLDGTDGESHPEGSRNDFAATLGNSAAGPDPEFSSRLAESPAAENVELVPQDGTLDDSVERSVSGILEEPQTKAAAPVSFIEKYRHLLDDEEEQETAVIAEPLPVASVAPAPQPTAGEGEDDTIEAYMAKMMDRLRGESSTHTPASQAPPQQHPTAPPVVETPPPKPKPSPLLSLDELTTAAAPERNTNMSALRDLANNSARHAIGMANSRRHVLQARSNLFLTAVAASTGGYLAWNATGAASLEMVGGLIGVGGAALWGCRTLSFIVKARRESGGKHNGEVHTLAPPAEDLLPIDVSPARATMVAPRPQV